VAIILDAGAFVAVDRDDRRVLAMLRVAQKERSPLRSSGAVVAQVWRHGARQVRLATILAGVDIAPLDGPTGRTTGELLRSAGTSDVVDGHIAVLVERGDSVLTSDRTDIERLLSTRRIGTKHVISV
jgi:hypothetical protein